MKEIDTEEFEEIVYDEEETAAIFFHRQGCHVCEELEELLESIEDDYVDKMVFSSVDVEAQKELFSRFGLKGVPQVILFQAGSPVKIISGLKEQSFYEEEIADLIGG